MPLGEKSSGGTRTRLHAEAVSTLQKFICAKIRVDRVDPSIAAPSVEEETDSLGRRTNVELGVVAAASHVVDGLENEPVVGAIVLLALEGGADADGNVEFVLLSSNGNSDVTGRDDGASYKQDME